MLSLSNLPDSFTSILSPVTFSLGLPASLNSLASMLTEPTPLTAPTVVKPRMITAPVFAEKASNFVAGAAAGASFDCCPRAWHDDANSNAPNREILWTARNLITNSPFVSFRYPSEHGRNRGRRNDTFLLQPRPSQRNQG